MSHHEKIQAGRNKRAGVWRHARALLVLAVVAAIVSGNFLVKVEAAAGDLDKTFSTDGKKRTIFGPYYEYATDVAIQSDGKIVEAGHTFKRGTGYDFAVVRYNVDGTPDTTFSDDGRQTTDIDGVNNYATSVAIQSDGKILVAGTTLHVPVSETDTYRYKFALVRYHGNGDLDKSFSGDGIKTTDVILNGAQVVDLAIQPDGKIVVCGNFSSGVQLNGRPTSGIILVRYHSNGVVDKTFGINGRQSIGFTQYVSYASSIAIQPDGKIVVAGTGSSVDIEHKGQIEFRYFLGLIRVNSDGTPDTNFGYYNAGTTDTVFNYNTNAFANDLAIQSDGKLVVAGYVTPRRDSVLGKSGSVLVRYTTDGMLDVTFRGQAPTDIFGTGGVVTTDFFPSVVAIQSDDKIVTAGSVYHGSSSDDIALARYNVDGTLDVTFSGDGKQTTNIAVGSSDTATAIAIQTDGKIVVAGHVLKRNGDSDFVLVRYLGD